MEYRPGSKEDFDRYQATYQRVFRWTSVDWDGRTGYHGLPAPGFAPLPERGMTACRGGPRLHLSRSEDPGEISKRPESKESQLVPDQVDERGKRLGAWQADRGSGGDQRDGRRA